MKRLLVALVLVLAGCSKQSSAGTALIVIDVPLAKAGALAQQIVNGARLAIEQINAAGGVSVGKTSVKLSLATLDSDLSPETTASNVREAVRRGAVAVIDEGTGTNAAWQTANDAGIPFGIVYQGGQALVDPKSRPNVFRIAPTDRGAAFRLAEYLVPKHVHLAIIHDDSTYGTGGAAALERAFARDPSSVATTIRIPATATDVSAQVLQARKSGATSLLVWARPAILAQIIRTARSSGWNAPVYASTTGEDPLVREQLADHATWIEGMTFVMSRLTSERGPEPFAAFRAAYQKRFGVQTIRVRSNGKDVEQVPDQAMYSYDLVNVLAKAMKVSATARAGSALLAAMNHVDAPGANGDERSFNDVNHEGVVDDDIFFAVMHDMVWEPVKDDALSATLPKIAQTR